MMMKTDAPERPSYSGIQALRFFAAASVLIYHSIYYFGVLAKDHALRPIPDDPVLLSRGVTVFFVISGFVMAMLAERSRPLPFLIHRAVRIYGGYVLAVLIAAVIKFAVFRSLPPHIFSPKSLSLLPFGVRDYPLGIEWTLIYEVFFYLVVALLMLIPREGARRCAVLAWLAAIFVCNYWIGTVDRFTALVPTATQTPFSLLNLGFIAGMICWWVRGHVGGMSYILIPFGIALIVGEILSQNWLVRELMAVIGAAMLVLGAASPEVDARLSTGSLLARYGDASYGIYLIHVTLLGVAFAGNDNAVGIPGYLAGLGIAAGGGLAFGVIEFRLYREFKAVADRIVARHRPTASAAMSAAGARSR
jgi:peptidoglycan/LPS O-acetylase OafA/YrhL